MNATYIPLLIIIVLLAVPANSPAQDSPWGPLTMLNRTAIEPTTELGALGLGNLNKPNGRIYRLRRSIPPNLPAFVPATLNDQQLIIADPTPDGWLCLYKGPFPADDANCSYTALLVTNDNQVSWMLNLGSALSRTTDLEIQDIRYGGGLLFFNEACQSYSIQADGNCSALVCMDPLANQVLWRTPHLTANNIFIIHNGVIICGYGFTGEDDALYLVDAATGAVLSKTELDSAHDYLEIQGDKLYVTTYNNLYTFQLPPQMQ